MTATLLNMTWVPWSPCCNVRNVGWCIYRLTRRDFVLECTHCLATMPGRLQ